MAKVLSFVSWHDELYNLEFDDFWSTGGSRRGLASFSLILTRKCELIFNHSINQLRVIIIYRIRKKRL